MKSAITAVLLGMALAAAAPADATSTQAEPGPSRIEWFTDGQFGLRFRFELFSHSSMADQSRIAPAEYEKRLAAFNPARFSAEDWVDAAKKAGAQYILVVAKHRDGFCLFDSKATDFDVVASPFGRDLVREVVEECRKQGMRVGLCYSMVDWRHPDYLPVPAWQSDRKPGDFSKYLAFVNEQIKELCSNYGRIDALWLDGAAEHTSAADRAEFARVRATARSLQPEIVVGIDGEGLGDVSTFEQNAPAGPLVDKNGVSVVWESTETLADDAIPSLASSSNVPEQREATYKSAPRLIRTLVDVASKGGNLSLDVQPRSDGTVSPEAVERLEVIGQWLFQNKRAIMQTHAGPFRRLPFFGRVTASGDQLFVIVFNWPDDEKLRLPGLTSLPKSARLLSGGGDLSVTSSGRDVLIGGIPKSPPDPIASVIVVTLASPPAVEPLIVSADAQGTLDLPVVAATLQSQKVQRAYFDTQEGKIHLANWVSPHDELSWEIDALAGVYTVAVEYACAGDQAGSELEISFGEGRSVLAPIVDTGNSTFAVKPVGTIELPSGIRSVSVKPKKVSKRCACKLRCVRLERQAR